VQIKRKNGSIIMPFTILGDTFKTEGEATHSSLEYGKQIIDGKISHCSIEDI
jgi:hypothetical protein